MRTVNRRLIFDSEVRLSSKETLAGITWASRIGQQLPPRIYTLASDSGTLQTF